MMFLGEVTYETKSRGELVERVATRIIDALDAADAIRTMKAENIGDNEHSDPSVRVFPMITGMGQKDGKKAEGVELNAIPDDGAFKLYIPAEEMAVLKAMAEMDGTFANVEYLNISTALKVRMINKGFLERCPQEKVMMTPLGADVLRLAHSLWGRK